MRSKKQDGAWGAGVGTRYAERDDPSCEAALERVIRLAQSMLPRVPPPVRESSFAASLGAPPQSLERALAGLEPEVALKLRTLMIAGRDGKPIDDVQVNMTTGDSAGAFAIAAADASQNGPLLADYLRRGHALACATGLDLERPIAGWSYVAHEGVEARAWQNFGKQLARSRPGDWECMAFVEPAARGLTRLYLRLDEHGWWGFHAVLDRPSVAAVANHQLEMRSRRASILEVRSLAVLLARLTMSTEGRALLRAVKAVRARVGELNEAS